MKELVSVVMLAYQHAPWIEQAIQGVVNQRTDFPYRLYVHDDASTDGTREIIERWAQRYPDKIVAVLEDENQYSKKVGITRQILLPMMQGKYIATCEGDDYWTDDTKLQRQVDYMESHPECTLCFSNAVIVDANGVKIRDFLPSGTWNDKEINRKLTQPGGADFDVEEIIALDFTPTASNLYRASVYDEIAKFDTYFDLLIRIVATNMGYAHYFNAFFTAYRTGNSASAAGSIADSLERTKKAYYEKHKHVLEAFDRYTGYRHTAVIQRQIERKLLETYMNFDVRAARALSCYRDLTVKKKCKLMLRYRFGGLFAALKRFKYRNTTINT